MQNIMHCATHQFPMVVHLDPTADLQAAASWHAPGTTFVLAPGLYRTQQVKPKDGQSWIGAGTDETLLTGAVRILWAVC